MMIASFEDFKVKKLLKFSREISRVHVELKTYVLELHMEYISHQLRCFLAQY
jgi:hypothetical protein